MKLYLLRHGRTAYNDQHRYQGTGDISLSRAGEEELRPAGFVPDALYVSPLGRARRTAEVLFPGVSQLPVPGLREMDFGAFEGRTYQEMEHDRDYRAWVDGGCTGRCPGGEDIREFSDRVCAAFEPLVAQALQLGLHRVAVVAHGGTQMAVMERFALPRRAYFDWHAPCGGGFVLETDPPLWKGGKALRLLESVRYTAD